MKTVANDETGRLRDAAYWKRSSRFVGPVDLLVLAVWAAQVVVVFLYTAAPVSYTHLDVYKRQGQEGRHGRRACGRSDAGHPGNRG